MPENDTTQPAPWVQPTREELLEKVREILVDNPERWDQTSWVDDLFASSTVLNGVPVDELRRYAGLAVPDWPEDEARPVCGTTGCIAGWTGILGSPPGTVLGSVGVYGASPRLEYPDGVIIHGLDYEPIQVAAQRLLRLDGNQAGWMFSSERHREELIDAIDLLLDDPDAELDAPQEIERTLRVVVIDVENGEEMWSRDFTNERDRDDEDWDWVEEALEDAHNQH